VDLDNLELPDDSDTCPSRLSSSKAVPTGVSVAVDFGLGIGREEDIANEHLLDRVNGALLPSLETDNSEGSGPRK
jgi:hypothetical protein